MKHKCIWAGITITTILFTLMTACGKPDAEKTPSNEPSDEPSQAVSTGPQTSEKYTIIFDRNTTPDNVTDDETYTYETTHYDEVGNEVTNSETSVLTVDYSENAYITAAVPAPEREGYYFAGWQTRPNVTEKDLVLGVSPYQWYFGTQSRFGDTSVVMPIAEMESLKEDGTATLYTRWVEMKDISSAEQLRDIGCDLYGAYRLTADIDLEQVWTPIGCYFSNYEFYETEWWTYAFWGTLDGNGHTISGLSVEGDHLEIDGYLGSSVVWHDDGDRADGCSAMFNAIAGATIQNLTLNSPSVNVTAGNATNGRYLYAAPVAAFDMGSTLTNVTVRDPHVTVTVSDEANQTGTGIFIAVSGMVGGGWSDFLTNCAVESGSITVDAAVTATHGGEVYVGGIVGECYAFITDCKASAAISAKVNDASQTDEDRALHVNIGGLSAASTSATGCTVDATVGVSVQKPTGEATVNVGGLSGTQRYQTVEGSTVTSKLTTSCTLDPKSGVLNVGAVSGNLDAYYTTQILMFTPIAAAGCTNNTADTVNNGQPVTANIGAVPELDGQPLGWINKGTYTIAEGYDAPSNIEAVAEKYGSYIPADYLMDGIIWIMTE